MIFTARQLEQLHRNNGCITLPYRARLTPLARDWVRQRKIVIGYSDIAEVRADGSPAAPAGPAPGAMLWWCDGPCGPAKAALAHQAKQSPLEAIPLAEDPKQTAAAVKHLAEAVKSGRAAGGVLVVQSGAAAMVYANRCRSLRAVLGTCLDAVEQGVRQMAANVLVIEAPYHSLQQVRNMLSRFVRAPRQAADDVLRQLEEVASCG